MSLTTGHGWTLHTTISRLNRETTPGSQGGPRVQGHPSLEKCTHRHTYSWWEDSSLCPGRRWIIGHLSRLLDKEHSLSRAYSQHSETCWQCSRVKPRSVGRLEQCLENSFGAGGTCSTGDGLRGLSCRPAGAATEQCPVQRGNRPRQLKLQPLLRHQWYRF